MSLIKKPVITEKKLAANRRNGSHSRGPVTEEGKINAGEANLRHGLYARAREAALRDLGEDPDRFEELLAGLHREFAPTGALQQELVTRLARVLWLADRIDRSQEGDALRRAQAAGYRCDNRLHARMMRLKMTAETLRSLARSVAAWHYVTTPEDLQVMKKLHQEGVMAEMGDIAMGLFCQLQPPNTDEDGISDYEKARKVVEDVKMIFGIGMTDQDYDKASPAGGPTPAQVPWEAAGPEESEDSERDDRHPEISEEDWVARERARKLLKNILSRQAEVCEAQRKALLRGSLAGLSPYELAAEFAPVRAEALLTRRMQESNLREVRRLTNLLLKIQRRKSKMEPLEEHKEALGGDDMPENKELSCGAA